MNNSNNNNSDADEPRSSSRGPSSQSNSPRITRRHNIVRNFLRSASSNPVFHSKAPSIIGSDVGEPLLSNRRRNNYETTSRSMEFVMQTPPLPHHDDNEDFLTVDWARDEDIYLDRQEKIEMNDTDDFRSTLIRSINAIQGWLLCAIVGVCTGTAAAMVDIAVHWAVDLKLGFCRHRFYLDYAFCCDTEADISNPINGDCSRWQTWVAAIAGYTEHSTNKAWWLAYLFYVIFGVFMATLSAWLVYTFAPYAAGSGIPEVKTILGGVVIKRYLGLWTLLIKMVGLVLSVGSGLSLGKEGPYVHIAGCFANVLSRWFPKYVDNHGKKYEILSASAAAGVAVAFGAPVGGVLFSLEEVSTYFPAKTMWRSFFCAIIAALTLQYFDPSQTGKLVLFQIDYNVTWKWFEIIPFALLGVLGGIIGVFFIRLNVKWAKFRKTTSLRKHPIAEIFMVVLVTTIVKYLSAFTRGSDNTILALFFHECDPQADPLNLCDYSSASTTLLRLFLTAITTIALTVFTFGTKIPAGLFIPSMVTGAAIGRMMGTMMRVLQHEHPNWGLWNCSSLTECITPGIYALVGAAAVLAGVTRMTVSLVVIMFELTGGLTYILPIMVGIIFAKWVGDAFGKHGIYDNYIRLHGYPFLEKSEDIPTDIRVEDIMSRNPLVLTMHGHTIDTLLDQLNKVAQNPKRINGFPIVTSTADMLVVGYITRTELQRGVERAVQEPGITGSTRCYFAMVDMRFPRNAPYVDLQQWLHPTPLQVVENTPLHRIHSAFTKLGLRYALVTRFGKLVGIVTKKDVHNMLLKLEEEH